MPKTKLVEIDQPQSCNHDVPAQLASAKPYGVSQQ